MLEVGSISRLVDSLETVRPLATRQPIKFGDLRARADENAPALKKNADTPLVYYNTFGFSLNMVGRTRSATANQIHEIGARANENAHVPN